MVSIRQSHLLANLESFQAWLEMLALSDDKQQQLERAYDYCLAYCEQKKLDDEFETSLPASKEIVEILAELNMDAETLLTAFLTPLYLNGKLDKEHLSKHFSRSVVELLKGVEQMAALGALSFQGKGSTQIDNIRRMLLAMVEDVRAVVIKLAQQVCLLRELKNASEEERVIAAKETDNIFAPLANRLGIGQLKWELEDLSLRYLHPEKYKEIAKLLDDKRIARESYMSNMVALVKAKLAESGIEAEVYGRPKHIYSIYKKMQNKNYEFDQLFDIRAMRVVVNELQDCYAALGIVHTNWRHLNKEFDDYIATPKANGYQSIHTVVFGPEGKTVEIQIRTQAMHQDAELGVAAHWLYKEGSLPGKNSGYEQKISWLRKLLQWQEEVVDDEEFAEELKNQVVEDRVYVFTPRGDILDLPKGATPLDFAYYIHSNVGHRCIGAKVFGKIVPFTHELHTGDQVEILTQKEPNPSRDWLNPSLGYVKSSRARSKIHHWFKQQDRDKNLAAGKEILDAELAKLSLQTKDLKPALTRFNLNSIEDLQVAVGAADVRINQLINFLQNKHLPQDDELPKFRKSAKPRKGDKNGIVVDGVGSLLSHVAKCCEPVPGDSVQGFITQGRGIAVHRSDCEQLEHLRSQFPERFIDVSWADEVCEHYAVTIRIEANDRQGLMRDISSVLANEKTNVLNMNLQTNNARQTAIFEMKIEINNIEQMNKLLVKLSQVDGVFSAVRT
ncbi:GTP diphosphokinase [Pseudoalteromonas spongiae]|uniref:GTP diphosphokinase n=1 Tax=Pseudoalteromonas spongiae TaxID=298657 RepID=UPI00026CA414|nr:GTP diphosphokinase [Pseudoalteromonas spongiae]ATC98013.1 GTP pyrophosphokinase [Pseudoalteromonas spongiae UST010723-006]